ncbi:NAD-dependent epimerase/dehydratase family protein [Streptomyces sp. P6-2-1]|uniref:NAD-dependent epimerase/dehydratase family protein n=1 Tax=Streptomyces sp. P6-2-1 TaxID=3422591 RepID=UPI003D36D1CA
MRVLFVGGTGVISSAAARAVLARGDELTVLTRGTSRRPVPAGARALRADFGDEDAVRAALGTARFDVVVDFIGYDTAHVDRAVRLFRARTDSYVYVSTGSVYARPAPRQPVDESSARRAGSFDYPRLKLECELAVEAAYRDGFPATIVRAAHVYDETVVPLLAGWTAIDRWRRGLPVVVHGDGTSLWNLLHARDFARALAGLLGDDRLLGESVHITSDTPLSWDAIHTTLARAAGAEPLLVHRSSEDIGREIDWMGPVLTEDFRHSLVYDNSKLHRLLPGLPPETSFRRGAAEILAWYDADPARRKVSADLDAAFDRLAARPG